MASLHKILLAQMLKRGGWWSSAEDELKSMQRSSASNIQAANTSEEWLMSCMLARECSLSSGWTGNGLDEPNSRNPLVEASLTDFTDLSNGFSDGPDHSGSGLVFCTSICGRVLLVARETLIFVYELKGSSLQPLSSVICPRRVLAMSMDISTGRNAVAALLEGRMGMVCELRHGRPLGKKDSYDQCVKTQASFNKTATRTAILTCGDTDYETETHWIAHSVFPTDSHAGPSRSHQQESISFDSVEIRADGGMITLEEVDNETMRDDNWIDHTWNLNLRSEPEASRASTASHNLRECSGQIPIESGSSTFYHHLCADEDPPRSVAICPQRQCVAFGCSAGIELHWIDAPTGQSLSRWFPLTAPSDYLYFLPPRPGVESAKKLRLISSAAHPTDRPALTRKFHVPRPTLSAFWASFGMDTTGGRPGRHSSDHFRAVPLSDGHHVLFLDPAQGNLYLGCDAPFGSETKLLRKMLLVPPDRTSHIPQLYTAAEDLTWGPRVVASYNGVIVLYSIPPDMFHLSRAEQMSESQVLYTSTHHETNSDSWLQWLGQDYGPSRPERSPVWPILIHGTRIGECKGVRELAVYTEPQLTVWAFGMGAKGKT